jgi:hypothetical protein
VGQRAGMRRGRMASPGSGQASLQQKYKLARQGYVGWVSTGSHGDLLPVAATFELRAFQGVLAAGPRRDVPRAAVRPPK